MNHAIFQTTTKKPCIKMRDPAAPPNPRGSSTCARGLRCGNTVHICCPFDPSLRTASELALRLSDGVGRCNVRREGSSCAAKRAVLASGVAASRGRPEAARNPSQHERGRGSSCRARSSRVAAMAYDATVCQL
jgi:hypothetical protein